MAWTCQFAGRPNVRKKPSQALPLGRDAIRYLAAIRRTTNPRIYVLMLTGKDTADSDLDVLVEPLAEGMLLDLRELQQALDVHVDVKTRRNLPLHIRTDVLRQAAPVCVQALKIKASRWRLARLE